MEGANRADAGGSRDSHSDNAPRQGGRLWRLDGWGSGSSHAGGYELPPAATGDQNEGNKSTKHGNSPQKVAKNQRSWTVASTACCHPDGQEAPCIPPTRLTNMARVNGQLSAVLLITSTALGRHGT